MEASTTQETASPTWPRSVLPPEAFAKLGTLRPIPWVIVLSGLVLSLVLWVTLDRVRDQGVERERTAANQALVDGLTAASLPVEREFQNVENSLRNLSLRIEAAEEFSSSSIESVLGSFSPVDSALLVDRLIYVGSDGSGQSVRVAAPEDSDNRWDPRALALPRGEQAGGPQAGMENRDTEIDTFNVDGRTESLVATRVYLPATAAAPERTAADRMMGWLGVQLSQEALATLSSGDQLRLVSLSTGATSGPEVQATGGSTRLSIPLPMAGQLWRLEAEADLPTDPARSAIPETTSAIVALLTLASAFVAYRNFHDSQAMVQAAELTTRDLLASKAELRRGFEQSPVAALRLDTGGRISMVNTVMAEHLSLTEGAATGKALSDFIHPEDRAGADYRIASLLKGERDSTRVEIRYLDQTGRNVWMAETMTATTDRAGRVTEILVQCDDVSVQRKARVRQWHESLHDELTGLANRALLTDRLGQVIAQASDETSLLAVLFVDLDRFKRVNEAMGHELGERLLVEVARRLEAAVDDSRTVARFGADEFVVLCPTVTDSAEVEKLATSIKEAIAEPVELAGQEVTTTASVGIQVAPSKNSNPQDILRAAGSALFEAKRQGRSATSVSSESSRRETDTRFELERDLRRAISNGELRVYFQPIVDAESENWVGFETLIRWHHPRHGLLSPASFLPVAEDLRVMADLDTWMARRAIEQMQRWSTKYEVTSNWHLALNGAASTIGTTAFQEALGDALDATGFDPARLVVEVTEDSMLEDSSGSLRALADLRQLGVKVAIDDFGTGYSSLSYLARFPIDILKIDQSFVRALPDPASTAVVRSIIDLAHNLDIEVVAEGVETEDRAGLLRGLGSDLMQGYLFAKPEPARRIEDRLLEIQRGHIDASLSEVSKLSGRGKALG